MQERNLTPQLGKVNTLILCKYRIINVRMFWICCTESISSSSFSLSINYFFKLLADNWGSGLWILVQFSCDKWGHVIMPSSESSGTPTRTDWKTSLLNIFTLVYCVHFFIAPQNQNTKGLSSNLISATCSLLFLYLLYFLIIINNQHFLWKQFGGFSDKEVFPVVLASRSACRWQHSLKMICLLMILH